MKKRLIYIILILSIMMYTLGRGSISWFMSTASSEANAFTAGTLNMAIGEGENGSGQIDLGGLAPDRVLEQRTKIVNKGTLPCELYGIRFSRDSIAGLTDLSDALNFHIYFTHGKDKDITALDIPVFYNYVDTIKEDLIIFYPITVESEDEITMVFRAELDLMQIEERHRDAEDSLLEFEILASQLGTPLGELSERYVLLEGDKVVQEALNGLDDSDVLVVEEGEYQCDRLILDDKENISIVGIGEGDIPEFKHIEDSNNSKKSNPDQYFLSIENCSGVIMRNIFLGYYKDNKALSGEASTNGAKLKKPLYIDGDYNQVNTYFCGEFEGKVNQGHIEVIGRNNIIFIDDNRYNPPRS